MTAIASLEPYPLWAASEPPSAPPRSLRPAGSASHLVDFSRIRPLAQRQYIEAVTRAVIGDNESLRPVLGQMVREAAEALSSTDVFGPAAVAMVRESWTRLGANAHLSGWPRCEVEAALSAALRACERGLRDLVGEAMVGHDLMPVCREVRDFVLTLRELTLRGYDASDQVARLSDTDRATALTQALFGPVAPFATGMPLRRRLLLHAAGLDQHRAVRVVVPLVGRLHPELVADPGQLASDDGVALLVPADWTAEHLAPEALRVGFVVGPEVPLGRAAESVDLARRVAAWALRDEIHVASFPVWVDDHLDTLALAPPPLVESLLAARIDAHFAEAARNLDRRSAIEACLWRMESSASTNDVARDHGVSAQTMHRRLLNTRPLWDTHKERAHERVGTILGLRAVLRRMAGSGARR